jgi:hypothetical protein
MTVINPDSMEPKKNISLTTEGVETGEGVEQIQKKRVPFSQEGITKAEGKEIIPQDIQSSHPDLTEPQGNITSDTTTTTANWFEGNLSKLYIGMRGLIDTQKGIRKTQSQYQEKLKEHQSQQTEEIKREIVKSGTTTMIGHIAGSVSSGIGAIGHGISAVKQMQLMGERAKQTDIINRANDKKISEEDKNKLVGKETDVKPSKQDVEMAHQKLKEIDTDIRSWSETAQGVNQFGQTGGEFGKAISEKAKSDAEARRVVVEHSKQITQDAMRQETEVDNEAKNMTKELAEVIKQTSRAEAESRLRER